MQPLRRDEYPELEELFRLYDETMWTGTVPVGLKPLVAIVASTAAGCRYCQAHETVDAMMPGVEEAKIAEILAVVGLFGFLNRWNDSMATDLEEIPAAFAGWTIGPRGWQPGKHAEAAT